MKDIRKYIRKTLNELTNIDDIPLPSGPDSESDKFHFDTLGEKEQWFWVLQNKAKIAYVSLDEDVASATLKGDESNFRENIYSKHLLLFKSGGGYKPVQHILDYMGIQVQTI